MTTDSEWPIVKLGNHVELVTGFPFKSRDYTDNPTDTPLIRGYNVVQGRLRWHDMKRWPASQYHDYEKYKLRPGDVILAMDRPWIEAGLKYAWIREQDCPCLLVQRVARLRGQSGLSTDFIRYIVGQRAFSEYLKAIVTGVNVPHISAAQIGSFEFALPPIEVQNMTISILSAYDDLIENNRRRIQGLEEMARAIYREWFVHFRFPGHEDVEMVDSELGEIPEGWEITSVGKAFDLVIGGTPSKKNPTYWEEGHINWHRPSEITKAESMFIDESEMKITSLGMKKSSAKLIPERSVIMTTIGTIGAIAINATPATTNQNCITCVPNERISPYHIYFWVRENATKIDAMASGAAYKIVTKTVMKDIEFLLPPQALERRFEKISKEIADLLLNLLRTNKVLTTTRGLLLPKLVSGQVDVSGLKKEIPADTLTTHKPSDQSTLDHWLDEDDGVS